jgi:hypothetical protein
VVRSSSLSLEQIADPDNLAAALDRAARGSRSSDAVARYRANASTELTQLRRELLSGNPRVGAVTRFQIFDPKPRLVQAPVFRERVLQHALMAHVGPVLDRTLVADTFACRVGKGTLAAVRRAQHHSRRFPWFGQLDIRQYFASIDHEVLLGQLGRLFRDPRVRMLLERIVRAGSTTSRGLPIGSLCSQHFANFHLNGLDRGVLQRSPARALVRYMDDLVCWGATRGEVEQALAVAHQVVTETLHLEFRDRPAINRVAHGLSFCGFRIWPGILRALPRRRRRFIAGRHKWEQRYARGEIDGRQLQRAYDSVAGILAQVDGLAWRRRQLELSPPPPACDEA